MEHPDLSSIGYKSQHRILVLNLSFMKVGVFITHIPQIVCVGNFQNTLFYAEILLHKNSHKECCYTGSEDV